MQNIMSTFRVVFHRHDPKEYGGRLMVDHIPAVDFTDAVRCARLMCGAMADADPSRIYKIATVSNEGLTGNVTASGWMTEDELSAKIAAEKAGKK